jgi:hypothetical protein
MSERRAAAAPPASRCEPDGSHSNTRTGRDRTRIETDGLISLLRSCCGRATVGGKFIETSQLTHHR